MFDHFLESSQWDDSNKWSNIGFDEEMDIMGNKNTHPIWSPVCLVSEPDVRPGDPAEETRDNEETTAEA